MVFRGKFVYIYIYIHIGGRGFHILKIVRKEKKTLIHLKNYYLKYFLAN